MQSLFFLLDICDLYIVTQLVKHLDKRLIHNAVLLVDKAADVRCGSSDHFRKLCLGDTFFQAFYLYIYTKIVFFFFFLLSP